MPGCDSSCFTKTRNVAGDPQQNLSITCSWNDILRRKGKKKYKGVSQNNLAWFFFFPFTLQNLAISETWPSRCCCSLPNLLEGKRRSEGPSADGEPLGRSESQHLSTDAACPEHPIPAKEAGGYSLCCAEPPLGSPGLILSKRCGNSFTLKVVKQGKQSLRGREGFTHPLAF